MLACDALYQTVVDIDSPSSLPGLTRQSITLTKKVFFEDARVKPADDGLGLMSTGISRRPGSRISGAPRKGKDRSGCPERSSKPAAVPH